MVKVAIFPRRKEAEPEAPPAGDTEDPQGNSKASGIGGAQGHLLFPPNYKNCFEFVKLVSKAMLVILGLGSKRIKKTREKKEKHIWSVQIMNELLVLDASFDYEDDGTQPSPGSIPEFSSIDLELLAKAPTPDHPGSVPPISSFSSDPNHNKDKENEKGKSKVEEGMISKEEPPAKNDLSEKVQNFLKKFPVAILATNTDEKVLLSVDNRKQDIHTGMTSKKETPILIAAKNGITEMVQKILEKYPVAIQDMNTDRKNIVLLAVENRQPHVYQLLLKISTMKESVFRKVDNKGNSALHLAATLGDHKPWLIPGAALQMQWELKWYEFVKDSMPFHFFVRYNKDNKTPKDIFTETHSDLVKAGGEWLMNTSESCSVVAALIATVAFATSATVPGGVKPDSGIPTLENQPAFNVFAISSLVALCFSVNAVIMFLSILTSRYQEKDFGEDLPRKLLIGLTSLFVSIASMLISFCAGHFFVLKDKLKFAALPVYAVTCLPVTFFAVAQFPLYFDLAWATFKKVPQRSYKSIPH
ncbi:uncharacterized protein LOC116145835 [Pistacia vera]|uniref:uncharacterized protein LOC116145835 n=1 Tax=Pistacia vera TaxID=55513 RepID=UPI001262DAC7|nr:uncharacterized protein LOC116145835 [Pistacia vera]